MERIVTFAVDGRPVPKGSHALRGMGHIRRKARRFSNLRFARRGSSAAKSRLKMAKRWMSW